jgi:hypothetical protein
MALRQLKTDRSVKEYLENTSELFSDKNYSLKKGKVNSGNSYIVIKTDK